MSALKLVVAGQDAVATYTLPPAGKLTLGRAEQCDVRIVEDSVSRKHAVLHVSGGALAVEDAGSVNGTYVQGARLEQGKRAVVAPGEAFRLGSTWVVLAHEPSAPARAAREDAETKRAQDDRARREGPRDAARVTVDPAMRELYAFVERIAVGAINVLILGETGVGKELVAETVHRASPRAGAPFVRLNCAALSEPLLEGELFGYERGAFTGATQPKPGLIESASGGTVFLDEIGEMPLGLQAKLLRALESGQLTRLGALRPRAIDVRFVAATNRDLERAIQEGTFRQDLYFRLNGVKVVVPPLRSRPADIEPLARAFLARACRELGRRGPPAIGPEALTVLRGYAWPGNVRELKNVIERAALLCAADIVTPDCFPLADMIPALPERPIAPHGAPSTARPTIPAPPDDERARILAVLQECGGNQSRAAKALGIARSTLVARLDAYGVPRPRK